MLSTALQAVAIAVAANPAAAQLAANARPGGAQVAAGQASIGGTASTTLINQASERAAINWQSYNVGSAQTVRYQQPNAGAVTLNTVLSANPSLIAGKILANGQIIIVNQSGVVFAKGSQVDTAGLVVSSAGISQKDFLAGRMVFSQAGHPGALISNAGNITVRQAGLAALVAPQVANSGTITANLGRVILAGATTHTLDLYGDGLVALNVTGQVTQISLDGKLVPALVTNTGTILAPGGTVVLTAAAADGVVTNLVSAGGTIAAPSVGAQTGRVLVQGIGGGVSIDGQVSATGAAAGTKGGQVEVNATGAVSLTPNALIDASGATGGGIISVGTTAARAIGGASVHPTLTAQSVSIAPGARIRADATRAGQGGRIAVLSRNVTTQAGTVTATGGPVSGSGGWVEVSGNGLALGGKTDALRHDPGRNRHQQCHNPGRDAVRAQPAQWQQRHSADRRHAFRIQQDHFRQRCELPPVGGRSGASYRRPGRSPFGRGRAKKHRRLYQRKRIRQHHRDVHQRKRRHLHRPGWPKHQHDDRLIQQHQPCAHAHRHRPVLQH
jgi:filamentous hemagglutinin family protein